MRKKGISLLELIVSIAILMLLATMITPVFIRSYNLYKRAMALYKIETDYISIVFNLKSAFARANAITSPVGSGMAQSFVDITELVPSTTPMTGADYLNSSTVTRSFRYYVPTGSTGLQDHEVRYYPDTSNMSVFATLAKGTVAAFDCARPTNPCAGPNNVNVNDCFFGIKMQSEIIPGAPTATRVQFNGVTRLLVGCRRSGP